MRRHLRFSRRTGRVQLSAVVLATASLVGWALSPASASGSLSSSPSPSAGVMTHSTNPADNRPGSGSGEEPCIRYTGSGLSLVLASGSVTGGGQTYTAALTGPVSVDVHGLTPARFEGPTGTYDPGNASQVTPTGCVASLAGATPLAYNTAAAGGVVRVAGSTGTKTLLCSGSTGGTISRSAATNFTIVVNGVSCQVSGGTTFTQTLTITAHVRVVGPSGLCVAPLMPNACEVDTASVSFSP